MRGIKLGIVTSTIVSMLVGCSAFTQSTGSQWKIGQSVQPSALPSAVVTFVDKAGEKIGDPHPKILSAVTDIDEPTQKDMYRLEITGDFTYGSDQATQLQIIVDADGGAGAFTDPTDSPFNQINLNKTS